MRTYNFTLPMNMRTLRFRRPSFTGCLHRKVGDERIKTSKAKQKSLEMGDFPLQILETKRKERLEELKAECLELKTQLSETNIQAALFAEADGENGTEEGAQGQTVAGHHSKSMHELRPGPGSNSAVSIKETLRSLREERLQSIRRELEQFAIKYAIGEYSVQIDGLEVAGALEKSKSGNLVPLSASPDRGQSPPSPGPLHGENVVNAAMLLRIQRQRELELQRARLELKSLAFRLKHKLDDNGTDLAAEDDENTS